jgi:hypothetical protein
MSRDRDTYADVSRKYDEFMDIQADKPVLQRAVPQKPYSLPAEPDSDMGKMVLTAIGVGIGIFLVILGSIAFYAAYTWADYALDGAATGYTLVGIFLFIAGFGGIAATINHNFRVLARPRGEH